MDTAAAISRAACPDPHVVCRTQLRPYSIGAWLHMQRCELSFVCGGEHTMGDLLLAVLICSQTHENFAGSLRSSEDAIMREVARFAWRLSGGFFGVWRRRFKRLFRRLVYPEEIIGFDFQTECRAMERYIAEHGGSALVVNDWSRPVTAVKGDIKSKPQTFNTPELMLLFNALTVEQGMPRAEVLDMPLPLARWERAVFCERKDLVNILDGADVAESRGNQSLADMFARKMEDPEYRDAWLRGEVK